MTTQKPVALDPVIEIDLELGGLKCAFADGTVRCCPTHQKVEDILDLAENEQRMQASKGTCET